MTVIRFARCQKLTGRVKIARILTAFHCTAPAVDVEDVLLMIGKILDHYRVVEKIGGCMSEVIVADNLNLIYEVAPKSLPNAFTRDPESMNLLNERLKRL